MFNLRKQIKDYLSLTDNQIEILFERFPDWRLHLALGATMNHFQDLDDVQGKRQYFKKKLI